ncbi:hypothetical protein PV11_08297 [Exophiala sideris]|uniref:Nucleoporin Nup159/Nup146 N-terminal domain-containing protein n=1 Tax=Exophiala sideris TaxID=1016849 RepID=A0A0D1X033_9EURO|nr:hypothetical protein PV11_08297 [Exophiala sideris]
MAFSFANAASGSSGFGLPTNTNGGVNVQDGAELQEIQTNELGFAALNGEAKLRLLPTPWPSDALPPPTSSLLSIASTKGLLAAAGPDALYITSTDKVREAFQSPDPSKDEKTRPYNPEIKIPQARLSQVVFSADDSVLVVSGEQDGGVAAFQVDSLTKGQLEPAVQIPTNGQSLRALVPNPVPESAELFALITTTGSLMLLDLKAGSMRSGSNGVVLKDGASCLSWSNRGKQLVVGLADGTAVQLKPDGTVVAQIPKSASISAGVHVSGISWLENDTFLIIYTPNDTSDGIQPSEYYIVNREPKTTNYTFQKLPEVLAPFGVERLPSTHFISRLRNFPPSLQDLLIVTATTATDVGLLSKSDKPLSQEAAITSTFTFTTIEDDTRRAQLPLTPDMQDTSPIGMAVDLSSTEKVPNPIPSEAEFLETTGPVPSLVVLNNEGILVGWWIIYNESIRQGTTYPALAAIQAARGTTATVEPSSFSTTPAQPSKSEQTSNGNPFAKPSTSSFAAPSSQTSTSGPTSTASPFLKSSTPTFGTASAPTGFGAPNAKPFGTSSPIASDKPSWASTGFGAGNNAASSGPAFGKPSFGAATPIGAKPTPAFGSANALGSRIPTLSQPSSIGGTTTFGQPSQAGAGSSASPFARTGDTSSSSGFGSFAKAGGFSSFASGNADQKPQSPFGAASGKSLFGEQPKSSFGADKPSASPFATSKPADGQSTFGNAGAFKVQSSFQGDGSAKDDLPKPKEPSGFGFGTSLGDILNEPKGALSSTHDKEADMDDDSPPSEPDSEKEETQDRPTQSSNQPSQTLVTPPATLSQPKATPAPPVSSLFGQTPQDTKTPQPQTTTPSWSFGARPSTTPKETPAPTHTTIFGTKTATDDAPAAVQKSVPVNAFENVQEAPKIKDELPSDEESVDLKNIPEAPLPPDPESKPRFASDETSGSSNVSKSSQDDAPLPPDFLPVPKAGHDEDEQPELPSDEEDEEEDDFSSDFEGSAEDVTGDISAEDEVTAGQDDQVQTSPESSFKTDGRSPETSPTGGLFTKDASKGVPQKSARPLFSEVGTTPVFAPPKPQESPRSPSPVRQFLSTEGLRVDPSRSVSAPAHHSSIMDQRKAEYQKSALAAQAAKTKEEEAAKEKARREAIARQKAQEEAEQLQSLEDDEDERLREELDQPLSPTQDLDDFITYQPKPQDETTKTGIPAQIERLYSDVNSMVYTLGINCRSLSAFLRYQQPEATNKSWPSVLESETPMDALNDEWLLTDISRLHEGQAMLSKLLAESQIDDFGGKVQQCQALIGRDLFELRTKLTSIRKTIHALSTSDSAIGAPLSAEQSSIQHDLRKSFTSVQTKLVQVEDCITILRAKVAQSAPAETGNRRDSMIGRTPSQKKPTVEAVTKTVGKMMSMAEQKSADVDLLESHLKKLDLSMTASAHGNGDAANNPVTTPLRLRRSVGGSSPSSIYHTPDSKFGSSTRSNRSFRASQNGGLALISAEDKERWQAQAHRRKEAADVLKGVLEQKRRKTAAKR